jgi:hypothetical protein
MAEKPDQRCSAGLQGHIGTVVKQVLDNASMSSQRRKRDRRPESLRSVDVCAGPKQQINDRSGVYPKKWTAGAQLILVS